MVNPTTNAACLKELDRYVMIGNQDSHKRDCPPQDHRPDTRTGEIVIDLVQERIQVLDVRPQPQSSFPGVHHKLTRPSRGLPYWGRSDIMILMMQLLLCPCRFPLGSRSTGGWSGNRGRKGVCRSVSLGWLWDISIAFEQKRLRNIVIFI